jgi:glycosyltransferase involved in cell wall biosynthesis
MRICFWGSVADALRGKTGGGGELQIALLAKALAWKGHEVIVLDLDTHTKFVTEDGITVLPVDGYNKGIRMIRTFTHRLPGLYSSFVKINADIYYCRIREYRHILTYMAAKKVKAKFVLGLASNLDILNFSSRWRHFYSSTVENLWGVFNGIVTEFVYPYLLRKADYVLVQHDDQGNLLKKKGINHIVFPNLIDLNEIPSGNTATKKHFVYVGSLNKRKGFAEFYDLVKRLPSQSFKVIGQPRDETGALFFAKISLCRNVKLLGRLNHRQTLYEIANSLALISTSPMEGFPNVFIEAWACGIPVLSLYVDPGSIIEREDLGVIAHGDKAKLLYEISHFEINDAFKERAKSYVERNHILNADKIEEIDNLFKKVQQSEALETNHDN